MPTHKQHSRFAKIAPDPERPSQQLRIRFDSRSPECAPILSMLEQTPYGQLKAVIAQALRTGAAIQLGQEPLAPPPVSRARAIGGGRFVITKRDTSELQGKTSLYAIYDPRKPWNAHIERELARCEWGETNRTMLRLLILGLKALGHGAAAAEAGIGEPRTGDADRPPPPVAPPVAPKPQGSSITIGVDPTRAQPRPAPSGATSLLRGAGRRGNDA
jgi:hypothetical protein